MSDPYADIADLADEYDAISVVDEPKTPGIGSGMLSQFNQGLSLGSSDEIVAGAERAIGGDYSQSLARQKVERDAFSREHPYLSAGSVAAGAVAPVVASTLAGTFFGTPAGGVAAAGATGGRALMLTRQALGLEGAQAVGRANTALQAAREGARAAVTPSAVAGYMTANPGERDMGALYGAGAGAVLGGGLGAGTQLAQNWGGRATPYLQHVMNALGIDADSMSWMAAPTRGGGGGNVTPITQDEAIVLQRMEEGGVAPEMAAAILERARRAGVPLALVDVAGQPVQRYARGIRSLPGEASATIDNALRDRAAGAPDRIIGHLQAGIGRQASGNAGAVADDLLRTARADSSPFYRKLETLPAIRGQGINDLMQIPAVQQIVQRAEANAVKFGKVVSPLFDDQGNLLRDPTFVDINRIKQSLDELLSPTFSMGPRPADALSVMTREEQAMARELRERLIKLADNAPGGATFRNARESYSAPARAREKYQEGLDFTRKDTSLEDVRATRRNGSPSDVKWYDRGVMEGLRAKIQGVDDLTGQPNVLRQFWGSPEARAKLGAVINPRREWMTTERLLMENQAAQTNAFVRSGSQTADKTAEAIDVAADVVSATPGGPKAIVSAAAQKLWERVRAQAGEKVRAQVAGHLVNMSPQQQQAFLSRLAELQRRGNVNAQQIATLANVASRQQVTSP